MRYRSVIAETLASVRRVGVRRSSLLAVSRVVDRAFDWYFDVDTARRMELDELAIDEDTVNQGQMYQPTGMLPFKLVMRRVRFPANGTFVDYGCGKGRTLLLASLESFRRVVGIEFSEELCKVAEQNARQFARKADATSPIEVVHQDAAKYEYQGDENILYFFYPFDAELMGRVMERVEDSLKAHPREAVLIYYYPIHREVLDASQLFRLEDEFELFGYTCLVYRYVPR